MPYITSTMSNSVNYAVYGKSAGGLPIVVKEITVNGGSNVINKVLVTPQGVVTQVSDSDLELLENHPVFKMHKENGYLKVHKTEKENTTGLEMRDASAQRIDSDYTKRGKKAPKVTKR